MEGKQLHFSGLEKRNPVKNNQHYIRMRLDSLILSGVVIMLLFALSFSLGFEQGKSVGMQATASHEVKNLDIEKNNNPAKAGKEIERIKGEDAQNLPQKELTQQPTTSQLASNEQIQNGYRIQVASFRHEDAAQRETQRLREEGYRAYYNRSGSYVVVYVGTYRDKTKAKNSWQLLRKKYKDCILRKL